jgi:hypothetical protein
MEPWYRAWGVNALVEQTRGNVELQLAQAVAPMN